MFTSHLPVPTLNIGLHILKMLSTNHQHLSLQTCLITYPLTASRFSRTPGLSWTTTRNSYLPWGTETAPEAIVRSVRVVLEAKKRVALGLMSEKIREDIVSEDWLVYIVAVGWGERDCGGIECGEVEGRRAWWIIGYALWWMKNWGWKYNCGFVSSE